MSVSVSGVDEGAVAAGAEADRRQAEYFRRLLQQRFSQLNDDIAGHYRRLTRHQIRDDFAELRRMRRMIRAEEQEQRSLQRMIEALDERFPELSATRRGREFGQG